jgi:hypothetical protein
MGPLTIVGIILFCLLALWAILRKQPLDEISLGNTIKAKFKDPPAEESVTFTVSWECEKYVLEGKATVTIPGSAPMTLSVARGRPFQTTSMRVPKAGQYAYSIEQYELREVYDAAGHIGQVPAALTGKGLIDIEPGSGFEVRSTWLLGQGGAKPFTELRPVELHVMDAGRRARAAKLKSKPE